MPILFFIFFGEGGSHFFRLFFSHVWSACCFLGEGKPPFKSTNQKRMPILLFNCFRTVFRILFRLLFFPPVFFLGKVNPFKVNQPERIPILFFHVEVRWASEEEPDLRRPGELVLRGPATGLRRGGRGGGSFFLQSPCLPPFAVGNSKETKGKPIPFFGLGTPFWLVFKETKRNTEAFFLGGTGSQRKGHICMGRRRFGLTAATSNPNSAGSLAIFRTDDSVTWRFGLCLTEWMGPEHLLLGLVVCPSSLRNQMAKAPPSHRSKPATRVHVLCRFCSIPFAQG